MKGKGGNKAGACDIEAIRTLYKGFYISEEAGNNAFSYNKRHNKKIYVAPLIKSDAARLALGDKTVFSEIEEGREHNRSGLRNFIYQYKNGKHVFIFDNHNHAYFFWMFGYINGLIEAGRPLVHIDQHSDMRDPQLYFPEKLSKSISLQEVFKYTNYTLNVGNFIQPALHSGLFSAVRIVDSSVSFAEDIPSNKYTLDIDMDIFSEDMSYINETLKIAKIKTYIKHCDFITVASSPYFIEQGKAVQLIKRLFH